MAHAVGPGDVDQRLACISSCNRLLNAGTYSASVCDTDEALGFAPRVSLIYDVEYWAAVTIAPASSDRYSSRTRHTWRPAIDSRTPERAGPPPAETARRLRTAKLAGLCVGGPHVSDCSERASWWPYGRAAIGQDDVRCKGDQLHCVSARVLGISRTDAVIDLDE